MKRLLVLAVLAVAPICSALPWGEITRGTMTLTLLPQRIPAQPLPAPNNGDPAEGFMVTVKSPDLTSDAQVECTVVAVILLQSGKVVIERRSAEHDSRFPMTIWFGVGPVEKVVALQVEIKKRTDLAD